MAVASGAVVKRFRPIPVRNRIAGTPDALWLAGDYTDYREGFDTDVISHNGIARQPATPGRPAGLQARVGDTQIALTWVPPDSYGWPITDALVEYRTAGAGSWSAFTHTPTTLGGITVTGLTNGQAYDFRVSAVTAAGAGPVSLTVTATPVPFNPSQVSGIWGWWKADALALSDGTAVASWTGSTSSARVLAQATTGFRPIYKTAQINGLPVVRFDGTDDFLTYGQTIGDSGGLTLYVLAKMSAGTAGTLLSTRAGTNGWIFRSTTGANGSLFTHPGRTPNVLGPAGPGSPAFVLYEVIRDANRLTTVSINGVAGTAATLSANPSAGATNFDVGAEFTTVRTTFLNGDIAEIAAYTTDLAAADRDRLKAYFASRYGLTIV